MHRGSVARGYTVTSLCASALLLAGHGWAYDINNNDNGGTSFVAEEMRFYECTGDARGTDVSCPLCFAAIMELGPMCVDSTIVGASNLGNSPHGTPCAFPFTYGGVEYNECTDADTPGQLWCPTHDWHRIPDGTGDWGYCDYVPKTACPSGAQALTDTMYEKCRGSVFSQAGRGWSIKATFPELRAPYGPPDALRGGFDAATKRCKCNVPSFADLPKEASCISSPGYYDIDAGQVAGDQSQGTTSGLLLADNGECDETGTFLDEQNDIQGICELGTDGGDCGFCGASHGPLLCKVIGGLLVLACVPIICAVIGMVIAKKKRAAAPQPVGQVQQVMQPGMAQPGVMPAGTVALTAEQQVAAAEHAELEKLRAAAEHEELIKLRAAQEPAPQPGQAP